MGHDTPGGDKEGPEVDGVATFEHGKDFDVNDGRHVYCESEHRHQDRGSRRILRERAAFNATVIAMLEHDDWNIDLIR